MIKSEDSDCIVNAMICSIILNVVLSALATNIATPEEVTPPNGAENLPLKSQFIHMLVHHNQVLLVSSLLVAVVVGLSVYCGYQFKLFGNKSLEDK